MNLNVASQKIIKINALEQNWLGYSSCLPVFSASRKKKEKKVLQPLKRQGIHSFQLNMVIFGTCFLNTSHWHTKYSHTYMCLFSCIASESFTQTSSNWKQAFKGPELQDRNPFSGGALRVNSWSAGQRMPFIRDLPSETPENFTLWLHFLT